MVRWGILGAGKIAGKFCQDLKLVKDAKIAAVGSRSIQKAQHFGEQYNIPYCYGSYEELAKSDEVDIIYIATPHHGHHTNTLLCLNNNKHVLCEKPIGVNATQTEEMIQCAQDNNKFLMEAIWTAFLPATIKVQQLISEGAIGNIKFIQADFGFKAPYDPQGRMYNPNLAGGALLDIGIYPLFLTHLLKGTPNHLHAYSIMTDTGVDATTMVQMIWDDGCASSQYSTILSDTNTEALISGDKGRIIMHRRWHETKQISLHQDGQEVRTWHFEDPCLGYKYEILECHRCLSDNRLISDIIPHQFSLNLSRSMDLIRRQIKLVYPFESRS